MRANNSNLQFERNSKQRHYKQNAILWVARLTSQNRNKVVTKDKPIKLNGLPPVIPAPTANTNTNSNSNSNSNQRQSRKSTHCPRCRCRSRSRCPSPCQTAHDVDVDVDVIPWWHDDDTFEIGQCLCMFVCMSAQTFIIHNITTMLCEYFLHFLLFVKYWDDFF